MARDRQRAKQRKQRREPTPPSRDEGAGLTPEPRGLHRENVPGPVEHTGDVEQFEAALVAGADGEPEQDPDAAERASTGAGDGEEVLGAGGSAANPNENASGRGGSRFMNFLRACWAELQRVQWPDRRQVGQGTAVTLGFVIVAGAYLGALDAIWNPLIQWIL